MYKQRCGTKKFVLSGLSGGLKTTAHKIQTTWTFITWQGPISA
jgi:hypothetical protein